MLDALSGATRVHFIVGDPIAQVKSPFGVTQAFEQHGRNAVCLPAHVAPEDLARWCEGVTAMRNVDGLIITVPHKFAALGLCASTSARSAFVGAANTLRRRPDGQWHGDMFDGLAFVQALCAQGANPQGQRVLLVGAGGAGSAIAHAVLEAGAAQLHIHDADAARAAALVQRLQGLATGAVALGPAQTSGHDILINATPRGMASADPLPIDLTGLQSHQVVGCVITQPAVTPLIAQARTLGCRTVTGGDMFAQVRDLMVSFLLEDAA